MKRFKITLMFTFNHFSRVKRIMSFYADARSFKQRKINNDSFFVNFVKLLRFNLLNVLR